MLLERLASGDIHLAGIVVLAPHLKTENTIGLLEAARGKSIRELERVAASLSPRPDAADSLRALPQTAVPAHPPERLCAAAPGRAADPSEPAGLHTSAQTPPAAAPSSPKDLLDALSAERFLFRFTGGQRLYDEYHRARDLLRLRTATGTMETVFERALEALLSRLDPLRRHSRRRRKTRSPGRARPGSSSTRSIPAAVRDAVWARDAGRCTFLSPKGERCPATRWLEIDHVIPYALGGRSDDIDNLRLLCRAHNLLSARRIFKQAAYHKRRG
jgi:5-methylcytosine-specific restriction endonuclease McrA